MNREGCGALTSPSQFLPKFLTTDFLIPEDPILRGTLTLRFPLEIRVRQCQMLYEHLSPGVNLSWVSLVCLGKRLKAVFRLGLDKRNFNSKRPVRAFR